MAFSTRNIYHYQSLVCKLMMMTINDDGHKDYRYNDYEHNNDHNQLMMIMIMIMITIMMTKFRTIPGK